MTYLIFGDTYTFPEGTAATNRVFNYAKGFIKNNISVHVISFIREHSNIESGIIDGIYYYHPSNRPERSKSLISRISFKLQRYSNTISIVRTISKKDHILAIHCYSSLFSTQLFAFFLSRIIQSKLILERGEHPLRNYNNTILKRFQGFLKIKLESRFCDSIFCISQFLIDFYQSRGVKSKKLFLSPSTVDSERFNKSFKSPLPFQYILYCGSLSAIKDGIDILIESFSRISNKFSTVNLVLIGQADTSEEELIFRELANKNHIEDKVYFLGHISRNEIPQYLCNASVLALARPKNIISDAGFPSKLTEYLATGNPVLTTKVGDIPLLLTHNSNVFLASPNSVTSFAMELDFILSNYEYAKKIGANGQKLTSTVFSFEFQAKRIMEYIKTM